MHRRLVRLAVTAAVLAAIPVAQAHASDPPTCLGRKATVVIGSNKTVEVRWDAVVLIKGDHNQVHVLEPGVPEKGGKSFVCVNGSHNSLDGTFYRAYSKPGHDNKLVHHDDPCRLPFDPRFFNFAQVDVQDCQD